MQARCGLMQGHRACKALLQGNKNCEGAPQTTTGTRLAVPVDMTAADLAWSRLEFFLDPSRLAGKFAQVIKLGAEDRTLAFDLDCTD